MTPTEYVLDDLADPARRAERLAQAQRRPRLLYHLGLLDALYASALRKRDDRRAGELASKIADMENRVGASPRPPGGPEALPWEELNLRRWTADVTPAAPPAAPQAVIVLGQPGAGKGAVIESLCLHFAARGQCVAVDAADLIYLHPDYAAIVDQAPTTLSEVLGPPSAKLAADLIERASALKLDMVIEKRDGLADLLDLVHRLKTRGYAVTVLVVHCPPSESWAAVEERQARREYGFGSWRPVTRMDHDVGVLALRKTLNEVEIQGEVERIAVITREGRIVFSADRSTGFRPGAAGRAMQSDGEGVDASVVRVLEMGGRKVKLGDFAGKQPSPVVERPVSGGMTAPKPKGFKLGNFAKPQPPAPAAAPPVSNRPVASPIPARPPAAIPAAPPPAPRPASVAPSASAAPAPAARPAPVAPPPRSPAAPAPAAAKPAPTPRAETPAAPPQAPREPSAAPIRPTPDLQGLSEPEQRAVKRRLAQQAKLRKKAGRPDPKPA